MSSFGNFVTFGGSHRRKSNDSNNEFIDVLRLHTDLWDKAFLGKCIICCPLSASLSKEVSRDDLLTHILVSVGEGEFHTMNNLRVSVSGQDLITLDGFPENRRIRILSIGQIVNAKGIDTTVYRIGRPLVGGISVPNEIDEVDQATARKFILVLKSYPETEEIFIGLDEFINELLYIGKNSKNGFARIKPSLSACIFSHWQKTTYQLLKIKSVIEGIGTENMNASKTFVGQIVESYLLSSIMFMVKPYVTNQYLSQNKDVDAYMLAMNSFTQSDFDIKYTLQCNQSSAINELISLSTATTPSEMLMKLKNVVQFIRHKVDSHVQSNFPNEYIELATDDIVLILSYVIIQSYPSYMNLRCDIEFIKKYHFVSSTQSSLGYNFCHFEVALAHIEDKFNRIIQNQNDPMNDLDSRIFHDLQISTSHSSVTLSGCVNKSKYEILNWSRSVLVKESHERTIGDCPASLDDVTSRSSSGSSEFGHYSFGNIDVVPLHPTHRFSGSASNNIEEAYSTVAAGCTWSSGGGFFVALGNGRKDVEGKIYSWGYPGYGRMGRGLAAEVDAVLPVLQPLAMKGLLENIPVKLVSCGRDHALAVNFNGELYSWGDNRFGQLGNGETSDGPKGNIRNIEIVGPNEHDNCRDFSMSYPTSVNSLKGKVVVMIACGDFHSLCVVRQNTNDIEKDIVYSWGRATHGRLGQFPEPSSLTPNLCISRPHPVKPIWTDSSTDENACRVSSIAAGHGHSLLTTESGKVFSWGCGLFGRLGHGSHCDEYLPKRIASLETQKIITSCAGPAHSIFLTHDGLVYSCGLNMDGQVSSDSKHFSENYEKPFEYSILCPIPVPILSSENKTETPTTVTAPSTRKQLEKVIQICSGENVSLALTQNKHLYMWGTGIRTQNAFRESVNSLTEGTISADLVLAASLETKLSLQKVKATKELRDVTKYFKNCPNQIVCGSECLIGVYREE